MICPDCKSERGEGGKVDNIYGVVFKADSSAFMGSKTSTISEKVSLDCGTIFEFKAIELKRLNK